MSKKIIAIIGTIIVLYLLVSIAVKMPISGSIINSATGEPISNIKIERIVEVRTGNVQGDTLAYTKTVNGTTDNNGEFLLAPMFLFKGIPLLTFIGNDTLNINSYFFNEIKLKSEKYKSANEKYYYTGFRSVRSEEISLKKKIFLSPVVEDIKDCNGNEICIEDNSFDIALKTKDEKLCLNIQKNKSYMEQEQRNDCLKILALHKNNSKICDLINREQRKNTCKSIVSKYGTKNSYYDKDWDVQRNKEDYCWQEDFIKNNDRRSNFCYQLFD
jgi:hypothetical protein